MKTIRLLYPDFVSGGLDEYYFGSNLMAHILPKNEKQKLVRVAIEPPTGKTETVTDGIYAQKAVTDGIKDASDKIKNEVPDKIITIGGNCLVSLAPFDYLHGLYGNVGIIWIDAHPDVSCSADGYPNAHAMVLRTLLGNGEPVLANLMHNGVFPPKNILYVGLQNLHDYQQAYLDKKGVNYKVQTDGFLSIDEIRNFARQFSHVLVHFDIDVLDEHLFHSTYFANPELVGDGSGSGKMKIEQLTDILVSIQDCSNIAGFTVAEYLPFDEYRLHKMFSKINLLTE